MKIINLRKVSDQEIPDSYMGILRISPYKPSGSEIYYDNITAFLNNINEQLPLSASDGSVLPLTFVPKKYNTIVADRDGNIDLINITHHYNNLYIANSLNVKPTLFIDISDKNYTSAPITFVNKKGSNITSLSYPFDAPDDTRYVNYNSRLFPGGAAYSSESINEQFNNLDPTNEIYTNKYSSEHVKIRGNTVYKNITYKGKNYIVPEVLKRDYILGQCPGHTFKATPNTCPLLKNIAGNKDINQDSNIIHTKLSFIPLENIIWKNVEAITSGVHRHYKGRYKNLGLIGTKENSSNDLFEKLFGDPGNGALEEIVNKNSLILGTSVQSGTIHYNAIPILRYMFQCLRRMPVSTRNSLTVGKNKNNITSSGFKSSSTMNTLTREYALCDGKILKNKNSNSTSYPQLNNTSTNFASWSEIYSAIGKSMIEGSSTVVRTPPLFEMNQFNLRYLRCLNWLRGTGGLDNDGGPAETFKAYDSDGVLNTVGKLKNDDILVFANNNKKYIKVKSLNDPGNIVKDIHQVGMYLSTNDTLLRANRKHVHLEFATDNELPEEDDKLSQCAKSFKGESPTWYPGTTSTDKNEWINYISLNKTAPSFKGTQILRTIDRNHVSSSVVNDNILKKIKNAPIAFKGGSISFMHSVICSFRWGKLKWYTAGMKCHSVNDHANTISTRGGAYKLSSVPSLPNYNWRFISSLLQNNRFGKPNKLGIMYSYANYDIIKNDKLQSMNISIDDSIPMPPSINFIPLIKI